MLILLPPSETKRDGGSGAPLDIRGLAFPALGPQRRATVKAVRELARDLDAALSALKLGPRLVHEVERNRRVTTSPTMPAIDRFTGVLFDGLDAATLTPEERAFAHQHVAIHSAMLGTVAALDAVPVYRLSHDSRLPGLTLKRHWSASIGRELHEVSGLMLDLRSEGYGALGPAPERAGSFYLRVLSEGADGRRRALNHFNKKSKGEFTRAVIRSRIDFGSLEELIEWATTAGWRLERVPDANAELALIV